MWGKVLRVRASHLVPGPLLPFGEDQVLMLWPSPVHVRRPFGSSSLCLPLETPEALFPSMSGTPGGLEQNLASPGIDLSWLWPLGRWVL